VFLSLGAGLLMLHKARLAPKLRYGMDVALLTFAVVAVPGAASGSRAPWEWVHVRSALCFQTRPHRSAHEDVLRSKERALSVCAM